MCTLPRHRIRIPVDLAFMKSGISLSFSLQHPIGFLCISSSCPGSIKKNDSNVILGANSSLHKKRYTYTSYVLGVYKSTCWTPNYWAKYDLMDQIRIWHSEADIVSMEERTPMPLGTKQRSWWEPSLSVLGHFAKLILLRMPWDLALSLPHSIESRRKQIIVATNSLL